MRRLALRYIIILLALATSSLSIQAQDLIVTAQDDSLNCIITKIKPSYIYFTFKHKDEIRNTLLPMSQVKFYQQDYYQTAEIQSGTAPSNSLYPHFRLAVNGGLSFRIAKIAPSVPSVFEEYMKDLKSGYYFGGDVSIYLSEQLGIGFKYSNFGSKNVITNVSVEYADGTTGHGKMSDDISIHFIGPLFSIRFFDAKKKNCFLTSIGLGYMGYVDDGVFINNAVTIKGNTLGMSLSLGYDIGLSKSVALGFQFTLEAGTLTQYQISDGNTTMKVELEESAYESLTRIDLSIGLRLIN